MRVADPLKRGHQTPFGVHALACPSTTEAIKTVNRRVEPELLDSLPADDPGAVGSRRDLQRLNAWMGHGQLMARALRSALDDAAPQQLVELGAGDGEFM